MPTLRQIKRRHDAGTVLRSRAFVLTDELFMSGAIFFDDEQDDVSPCPRCHGDGMDPWNDYILPCPVCSDDD